ncbi:MAG: STAS/SEC14 domain-containing protein [Desulfobacterales bacterium]|nr:STAS/SEC14 domain-containing protein [Deltaproteobacteria bacterium]NNL76711.1 STAS/SEC14 domain-containing protein [Desulfobacterales bacterium]
MFPVGIEKDIVIVTSKTGQVEHADVIETLTFLADDSSSYQNKKLLIIDPSSDYNPSREELQQFINLIKVLLEKAFTRIALVVSKEFHYGLGRMTEAFSESGKGQFRVFNDAQEAREWLSI